MSENNPGQPMTPITSRRRGVLPSLILTSALLITIVLGVVTLKLSSGHKADNGLETAMNRRYGLIPGMIYVYFKNEAEPIDASRTLEKYGVSTESLPVSYSYQQKYHYYVYVSSGELDNALATFRASPLFEKAEILYQGNRIPGHYSPINPYGIGVDSSFAADTASLSSFFAQHPEYRLKPSDPSLVATLPDPNPVVFRMFVRLPVPPGSETVRCQEFVQSAAVARCAQAERDTPPGALY